MRVPQGHPRAHNGFVAEHVVVAEAALGRFLPSQACVHHVNGDPTDNRPRNLVVCQDNAYHKLIHQRLRAYKACANANYRLCQFCGRHDDPTYMYIPPKRGVIYHRVCRPSRARGYTKEQMSAVRRKASLARWGKVLKAGEAVTITIKEREAT